MEEELTEPLLLFRLELPLLLPVDEEELTELRLLLELLPTDELEPLLLLELGLLVLVPTLPRFEEPEDVDGLVVEGLAVVDGLADVEVDELELLRPTLLLLFVPTGRLLVDVLLLPELTLLVRPVLVEGRTVVEELFLPLELPLTEEGLELFVSPLGFLRGVLLIYSFDLPVFTLTEFGRRAVFTDSLGLLVFGRILTELKSEVR